jgi:hypothetical protein
VKLQAEKNFNQIALYLYKMNSSEKNFIRVLFPVLFPLLLITSACKKTEKVFTPVPFLTGKKWTSDTITIIPPTAYNQLNPNDQQAYRIAVGFFKNAFLVFNEDGTVTGGGDYDFGYYQWKLINNNTDIEALVPNNRKDTLFNWTADNQYFAYRKRLNQSFDCTVIFK